MKSAITAAQGSEDKEASKNIIIEQLETTYRYENDGRGEIKQATRLRVLTRAGRDAIAQISFAYSSQLEDLYIDYFRTLKTDGARTDVDPATAIDVPTAMSQLAPTFSDVRAKALVAANLEEA